MTTVINHGARHRRTRPLNRTYFLSLVGAYCLLLATSAGFAVIAAHAPWLLQ